MVDSVSFCLTTGCYTFTINDQFGDGICCEEGDGNYVILAPDSTILAENDGDFGFQNIDEFCLEAVGIAEFGGVALNVHPNPTNGLVYIEVAGGGRIQRLGVFDAVGRVVAQQTSGTSSRMVIDLSGLNTGVYTVIVDHARGRSVQRVVLQR
jgi:hypothetical protein